MNDPALPSAIRIDNVVKRYAPAGKGEAKLALKGVSFDVPQGEIFGLLGPNGAGKSTLINILAGLVNKTSGNAEIWGFDIDADPRNAKRSIGIVPQEVVFDPFFTPFEVLENQAGLYGVPKAARRSLELLGQVHLADKAHAYARTLSGGMKRRLLIANKPTRELVEMAREKVVVVTVDKALADCPTHPAFLKCEKVGEAVLEITYDKDKTNAGEVLSLVQAQGLGIVDVTTREADLEDVFVHLTSEAA